MLRPEYSQLEFDTGTVGPATEHAPNDMITLQPSKESASWFGSLDESIGNSASRAT